MSFPPCAPPTPSSPRLLSKFAVDGRGRRSALLGAPCAPRPPARRTWRDCRQSGRPAAIALAASFDGRFPLGGSPVRVYELNKAQSKRIVAEALVHAPVEQVWRVLTDYERLPSFVPNLESCRRLPCPKPGRVWVSQRACSQSLLWRLEAEAVLEIEELVEEAAAGGEAGLGRREARFSLVQGDFKELRGRWVVEPCGMASMLRYDVTVVPKQAIPFTLVNHVVRAGLPANILAVTQRAEQLAAERLKPPAIASWALEDDAPLPGQPQQGAGEQQQQQVQQLEQLQQQPLGAQGEGPAPACAFSPPPQPEAGEELAGAQQAQQAGVALEGATSGSSSSSVPGTLQWDNVLPSSGPFWSLKSRFAASAPLTAAEQLRRAGVGSIAGAAGAGGPDARSLYLGVVSVPLPPAGSRGGISEPDLQAELNERQRQKEALQATYPAFGLRRPTPGAGLRPAANSSSASGSYSSSMDDAAFSSGLFGWLGGGGGAATAQLPATPAAAAGAAVPECALAEVHLRRLDGFDYLHRRAVAAITIDAPPETVWAALTDYDRLAEFVPNLAVSQRIALPPGAPPNVVRLRQVGYKRMLYMSMHAESVLDLVEKPCSEIQFRQVAGDFERFQGKWMLAEVQPSDPEALTTCTELKYAVEILIPRSTRLLGVMEPILERCVFEDMPANLWAIKRRVECLQSDQRRSATLQSASELEEAGEVEKAAALRKRAERPRPREMVRDFNVLAAELERCFGDKRELPSSLELREMGRFDLYKAVTAHGGPAAVAQALGWERWGGRRPNRKPRGYWDSLDNVRAEIDGVIAENGLPPGVIPSKMELRRLGCKDLEKGIEKWGGMYALAEELGYAVERAPAGARGATHGAWHEHMRTVAASTGLGGNVGLFELAAKTYTKRSSGGGSSSSLSSLSSVDLEDAEGSLLASLDGDSAVPVPATSNGSVRAPRRAAAAAARAAANGSTNGAAKQSKAAAANGATNGAAAEGPSKAPKPPLAGSSSSVPRRRPGPGKGVSTIRTLRQEIDSW